MSYLKLLFIRHAESVGNQQQRMQGHTEVALSETGKRQAQLLAERLASEFCQPSHLYSSPLLRACQTTEILLTAVAQPIAVEYIDDLREFQTGIFTGLTWAEAKAAYPDLCSVLESSVDWVPIPGAESLQAGRDRAHRFIQHLLDQHLNGDCLWIVTHHWVLQHLVSTLLGSDRTWGMAVPCTALFEFWVDQLRWHRTAQNQADPNRLNADLWQIRRFNDSQHLGGRSEG